MLDIDICKYDAATSFRAIAIHTNVSGHGYTCGGNSSGNGDGSAQVGRRRCGRAYGI